jgi:hypothetical protein
MQKLVEKEYQGLLVQFTGEGWINATVVAEKFGKEPFDWLRQRDTVEYVVALTDNDSGFLPELNEIKQLDGASASSRAKLLRLIKKTGFIKTKAGAPETGGGTWLHPELGVFFARWLDVKFAVWCDRQIKKIIIGELDTKRLRHKAASTNKLQNSILQLKRAEQGKPTRFFHYANEARLVNQVLTGDWSGIDRDSLTQAQLDKLAKLEEYNTVLIAQDIELTPRRLLLRAYADGLGTYSALN